MKKPRVGGGVNFFFTLYRSIYYILVGSETKCLLYRILGVGDGKKTKKKSQKWKKKVVVPNTTMQIPPHCRHLVEVQVFRQSGPSEQRPNGNSSGHEQKRRKDWGADFFCFCYFRTVFEACFWSGGSFRER